MMGRREEEGETEYTLRTVVAKQTDRWEKDCGGGDSSAEVQNGLKGLPLLGMQGTGRLKSEHSEEKEELRDWLTAVLE